MLPDNGTLVFESIANIHKGTCSLFSQLFKIKTRGQKSWFKNQQDKNHSPFEN